MALYKDSQYLGTSIDGAFDVLHRPGATTPDTGVYRCESCGHEIVSNTGSPLPRQEHHQHGSTQGSIRWRMIVFVQGS
ncbi:MAG TPA: hypothetical protein VL486_12175 [Verrucomicrobiae bacterium]|nr:hypothetical protein [Verrucomicrobiae bacterium]